MAPWIPSRPVRPPMATIRSSGLRKPLPARLLFPVAFARLRLFLPCTFYPILGRLSQPLLVVSHSSKRSWLRNLLREHQTRVFRQVRCISRGVCLADLVFLCLEGFLQRFQPFGCTLPLLSPKSRCTGARQNETVRNRQTPGC